MNLSSIRHEDTAVWVSFPINGSGLFFPSMHLSHTAQYCGGGAHKRLVVWKWPRLWLLPVSPLCSLSSGEPATSRKLQPGNRQFLFDMDSSQLSNSWVVDCCGWRVAGWVTNGRGRPLQMSTVLHSSFCHFFPSKIEFHLCLRWRFPEWRTRWGHTHHYRPLFCISNHQQTQTALKNYLKFSQRCCPGTSVLSFLSLSLTVKRSITG